MALKNKFLNILRLLLMFLILTAVTLVSAIGTIRLSMKGSEATLPSLRGFTVSQAQQQLLALQVQVKVEDEIYDQELETGHIISQIPLAGNKVKIGQRVYVLVSLGEQKSPVPNLVGMRFRAAKITLLRHDLTARKKGQVEKTGTEVGQILAQEPLPTQEFANSPTVSLLVSHGAGLQSYLAPDLIGKSLTKVRRVITNSGLPQPSLTYLTRKDAIENSILAQIPLPGAKIGARTIFELQVATQEKFKGRSVKLKSDK